MFEDEDDMEMYMLSLEDKAYAEWQRVHADEIVAEDYAAWREMTLADDPEADASEEAYVDSMIPDYI